MIHWETGIVLQTLDNRDGLQEVSVLMNSGKHGKAIHYTDVQPSLQSGDVVLLNTTAVDLELGSGGKHFVYAIIPSDRIEHSRNTAGHIMKLRYTAAQRKVLSVEEQDSPHHEVFTQDQTLDSTPVLIGELHSMLPIAVCWLRYIGKKLNIVYVMSDGGALPLAYSNHVALLNRMEWLQGTVTYGHAYGGDLEAINKWTALIAAKQVLRADVIIAAMGPGITGTGTRMGFSGMEAGELINATHALGGIPILMPRISFIDKRERHFGISHHSITSLTTAALKQAVVPLPQDMEEEHTAYMNRQFQESGCNQLHRLEWIQGISMNRVEQSQCEYDAKITTMGRGLNEDPHFFQGVCAAAQYAWNVWHRKVNREM